MRPWRPGSSPVVSEASADAVVDGKTDWMTSERGAREQPAGVAAMSLEREGTEPVDEQHDGVTNDRQRERAPFTLHGQQAIRQHVGEAEPVGFRRR